MFRPPSILKQSTVHKQNRPSRGVSQLASETFVYTMEPQGKGKVVEQTAILSTYQASKRLPSPSTLVEIATSLPFTPHGCWDVGNLGTPLYCTLHIYKVYVQLSLDCFRFARAIFLPV
jgi:hypothetical protein